LVVSTDSFSSFSMSSISSLSLPVARRST
jgi:hypothetical protein